MCEVEVGRIQLDSFTVSSKPSFHLEKPQWSHVQRSRDFQMFSEELSCRSYNVLFRSNFPVYCYEQLNRELSLIGDSSEYFLRMMQPKENVKLKKTCEAIALLASGSNVFPGFFLSFDCLSPLFRVLDVDRGDSRLYAITALTHIIENIPEIVLNDQFIEKLFSETDNAKELKLKKHFLFCLSSVAFYRHSDVVASRLYQMFDEAAANAQFLEISIRGLSNLSKHYPELIVNNDLIPKLIEIIIPENEIMVCHIMNLLGNVLNYELQALTEHLDSLMQKIWALLESPTHSYTLEVLKFLCVFSVQDQRISQFIVNSPLLKTIHSLFLHGAVSIRTAAAELIVCLCESSANMSDAIITQELISDLIDTIEATKDELGCRLIDVVTRLFQGVCPDESVTCHLQEVLRSLHPEPYSRLQNVIDVAISAFG